MGYQALLFCPDEKTARSVTQVLSELEFNVESCNEPFAAVKKLMGAHFDAIVVDCDNEQNATLLFKSARNSTSNQSSLAVAVVEGQAGVAKAFRIGANLVLTKPINIEQAKGTLRVARGLLRKGDPAKSAAPATSAAAPVKTPASAPVARPAVPAVAKPILSPARPVPAASASSAPVVRDAEVPAIKDSVSTFSPAAPPAIHRAAAPAPAAKASEAHPVLTPAASAPSVSLSSGAASAAAPAKEILDIPPLEATPASPPTEDDNILETPTAEPSAAASEPAKDVPPPTFTFGGANAPVKPGPAKKIFLGIAAAALVAGGLYAGWTYYQGHMTQPANPAPFNNPIRPVTPAAPKPSGAQPAPAAPSTATPSSQPIAQPAATTPAKGAVSDDSESTPDEDVPPASTKPSASASSKTASTEKPAPAPALAPLVVKGGAAPAAKAAPEAPDAPPPSVIGIAAPGSSGPLPNLGGSDTASKPVLQRLNVSQGVSQGLLIKRVDPVYPANALRLRMEGAVDLLATISKAGDITQVQVLSGDKQLTGAALDAVKRWKYKPYLLNGEPVEIQTQVTIVFRLPH
ncbi:MAG TPA: TonB family protein [Terracidiphilus sp.]|nr:TonB family protein [Terracidiphilus sp.]